MGFVPQMSRNEVQVELLKAQHARYARAFLLGIFLSVENKGCLNYIPKLKVASSILVARSKMLRKTSVLQEA